MGRISMSPSTVCHTVFNDAPQRATANMLLAYPHTRASHHYQTATNTHHPLSRLVSHHHILSTIEIVTSALKLPSKLYKSVVAGLSPSPPAPTPTPHSTLLLSIRRQRYIYIYSMSTADLNALIVLSSTMLVSCRWLNLHHLPQRLVRREARRPRGPWLSNA